MEPRMTILVGDSVTMKRSVEGMELTRGRFTTVKVAAGQQVRVVSIVPNGTRVRVRTSGFGYELWVDRKAVAK